MKINLSNYLVNTNEVVSIYPPSKYENAQKSVGCSVIPEYLPGYYKPCHISIKQTWGMLYKYMKKNIKYMIIYDDPSEDRKIQNIVHYAFKNGITVLYRSRSNCNTGLNPIYIELYKETNLYHSLPGNRVDYIGSYYTEVPETFEYRILKDRTKDKIRKYIKYYDITYPITEYDWYIALEQIKYYHKNKIPFAFDKNKYYICKECKELVLRGTEEEHVCYCDIVPKKTKMDYVVNGEL